MTENLINKKQYPALDTMKIVMAILVIIIHRKVFPDKFDFANFMLNDIFCQIAVPFFFITSSFLFFRSINPHEKSAKLSLWKTEKRLIILYSLWSVIYLPGYFVKSFTGHYSEITIPGLIGQFVVWIKDFFLNFSFIHLWYINSLIFTIALFFLLLKMVSSKLLLVIFLPLTFSSIFLIEKFQIHDITPHFVLKLFFVSGCCIALGTFTAKNNLSLLIKKKWSFTVLSIVVLFLAGTVRYFNESALMYTVTRFSAYIVAFFIFIICISSEMKPHHYDKVLRNCSTLMYFCHLLIMEEGFNYLAFVFDIPIIATHPTIKFIITTIFAFLFSIIVLTLSKRKSFKWLKLLY